MPLIAIIISLLLSFETFGSEALGTIMNEIKSKNEAIEHDEEPYQHTVQKSVLDDDYEEMNSGFGIGAFAGSISADDEVPTTTYGIRLDNMDDNHAYGIDVRAWESVFKNKSPASNLNRNVKMKQFRMWYEYCFGEEAMVSWFVPYIGAAGHVTYGKYEREKVVGEKTVETLVAFGASAAVGIRSHWGNSFRLFVEAEYSYIPIVTGWSSVGGIEYLF